MGYLNFIGFWLSENSHEAANKDDQSDKEKVNPHEAGLPVGFEVFDFAAESVPYVAQPDE